MTAIVPRLGFAAFSVRRVGKRLKPRMSTFNAYSVLLDTERQTTAEGRIENRMCQQWTQGRVKRDRKEPYHCSMAHGFNPI